MGNVTSLQWLFMWSYQRRFAPGLFTATFVSNKVDGSEIQVKLLPCYAAKAAVSQQCCCCCNLHWYLDDVIPELIAKHNICL